MVFPHNKGLNHALAKLCTEAKVCGKISDPEAELQTTTLKVMLAPGPFVSMLQSGVSVGGETKVLPTTCEQIAYDGAMHGFVVDGLDTSGHSETLSSFEDTELDVSARSPEHPFDGAGGLARAMDAVATTVSTHLSDKAQSAKEQLSDGAGAMLDSVSQISLAVDSASFPCSLRWFLC